jgi:type VII secretion protein EccB
VASKRDLVEAHDFNRRRLVTAFLSGAPGGREVEPVRYGRTIIGGVVLAALLVAGAAVVGVLKPAVGDDWRDNGLVIGKSSGSRFLMFDGNLYPIANIASARLAIEGEVKVSYVPDDILVKEPKLNAIGIVNAPDYLPPSSSLVEDGWTACTNAEGGLRTVVHHRPGAEPAADRALVARSTTDQSIWLIAGGYRHAIAAEGSNDTLRGLGLDRATPFEASDQWLQLIATGEPIEPFVVPDSGQPFSAPVAGLDTIGTPLRVDGKGYVLGRDQLIPLSDFAYAVYRLGPDGSRLPEREVTAAELDGLRTQTGDPIHPQDWPVGLPSAYSGSTPCLVLTSDEDPATTHRSVLATPTDPEASPRGNQVTVAVEQGRGALVYASTRGTGGSTDTEYLIDSLGVRYAIGPKAIRYRSVDPVPVPRAWTELFGDGPMLSVSGAGKPVA